MSQKSESEKQEPIITLEPADMPETSDVTDVVASSTLKTEEEEGMADANDMNAGMHAENVPTQSDDMGQGAGTPVEAHAASGDGIPRHDTTQINNALERLASGQARLI